MHEALCIEISCPAPGEWRVVERTRLATESVARVVYKEAELDELLKEMRQCLLDANVGSEIQRTRLRRLGSRLAEMVLPDGLRNKLASSPGSVEFFLDDVANNLPVELFPHDDTVLAEAKPVIRHWFCENAATLTTKHPNQGLQVLIVADPAENLPGAQKEGEELFRKLRKRKGWHPRYLGRAVTCAELSRELPDSDILHLAAHYVIDNANTKPGIVMADGLWMPSPNSHSPELVFVNSCRAGMTTGGKDDLSLVGRFLQRGSLHIIAPFLPASDQVACSFANAFYQALISGSNIASAMWEARKAIGPASWIYWYFGAQTKDTLEQQQPLGRWVYALALIPIVLLVVFLIGKNAMPDSHGNKEDTNIEAPNASVRNNIGENTMITPRDNDIIASPNPTSDNRKSGIRIAPDIGRDF